MSIKQRLEELERKAAPDAPGLLPTIVADGDTETMKRLLARGIDAVYFSTFLEACV